MGRSLIDANRNCIRPFASNSQFSLPLRAEPIPGVVMPFIGETHSNAVCVASPKLFDQPVIEFPGPFAFQKLNDLISSMQEFGSISPARVNRVRQSYLFRITRIPG